MKAFIESPRFNTNIRYGTAGGILFDTEVTTVMSGGESRTANWEFTRGNWTVGEDALNRAELAEVISMFRNCRGRACGFRFKDWADWYATKNQGVMMTVPTNPRLFQLSKAYILETDGAVTYRPIRKPVPGTVFVWRNGTLMDAPKIDYTTGLFLLPDDAAPEDTYEWSGEFDIPARFDVDSLNIVFQAYRKADGETMCTVTGLTIVELYQPPPMANGKVITPTTTSPSTAGYVPPVMPERPGLTITSGL